MFDFPTPSFHPPRLRSMSRAQFAPQRRRVMVVNARYIKDARTPESVCPRGAGCEAVTCGPQDASQRPRFGPCGRGITRVIRSARAGRILPRAGPHPLAMCRPACANAHGYGSRPCSARCAAARQSHAGRDQSGRLAALRGRPGWLPRRAEVLVLASSDRPNSLLVEPS